MKRNISKASSILSYVLIVLLLVGMCGAIAYFTNGFTTDFTSFYVVIDGEDVLTNKSGFRISMYDPLEVQVKYTMGFVNEELSGYSLELRAKTGIKFDYSVDGEFLDFQGDVDWDKCFDIVQNESSFTIKPKGNGMKELLEFVYPGQEVVVSDEVIESLEGDIFSLTIYSYNKDSSITIDFGLNVLYKIILDETEIIF